MPPIRDISLATKHRLSENEDYDKEDSADRNRPPLPRLNTQTRKHPDIDASRNRHAFSSRHTSPVSTPSFSMSLTQHSPAESSSRVHAAGLISDTTSGSSDLYPSPRERESYLSDFNTPAFSYGLQSHPHHRMLILVVAVQGDYIRCVSGKGVRVHLA